MSQHPSPHAYTTGRDVRELFIERQTRHEQALQELREGTDPSQALFWRF